MKITPLELQAIQQRLEDNRNPRAAVVKRDEQAARWAAGEEKSLQDAIQKDCERRGYFVLRSRMDKKTVYRKGFPDLVIFGPNGKCVLIETKSGVNKLSPDQISCIAELRSSGALVLTCWTLQEAIAFVRLHLE